MRTRQFDDMQDKLENLDDDFAAIKSLVARSGKKSSEDAAFEAAEKERAGSKFAKSLKSYIEKPKKKKVAFGDLKTNGVKGDDLYEGQKERLREKKAARKEVEQKIKLNKEGETKDMANSIQRNVNYDIMKARGIVRKRKHEDKNPRVKKRHQYEKMMKKHKTRVQDFADGQAQGADFGEKSGIRVGVKKSTKLN